METLKEIVGNGNMAKLSHVCNGLVYFVIETENHKYQLAIDSLDDDWENNHIVSEYKAITLMRWIRKGLLDENSDMFVKLV